nr:Heat shock protein (HSP20) [uncultured bacterium]
MKFEILRRNNSLRPEFEPFRSDFGRLFDDFFNLKYSRLLDSDWLPAMDVYDDAEYIYIKTDAAGFEEKDLNVSVNGNILTISGKRQEEEKEGKNYILAERRMGSFSRSITIPVGFNQEDIKCELKNGVLTTTVKKGKQEKKIQITVN